MMNKTKLKKFGFTRKILDDFHTVVVVTFFVEILDDFNDFVSEWVSFPRKLNNPFFFLCHRFSEDK